MNKVNIKRAFISYKWESEDLSQWVENFASDLRKNGVEALLDKWEVSFGDSFIEYMESQITNADYFLFIVSKGSVSSIDADTKKGGAVKFEVQLARAQALHGDDIVLVPILYDVEDVPKRLRGIRYADFRNPQQYETNISALINDIRGVTSKPPVLGHGKLDYDAKIYKMLPAVDGEPNREVNEKFEPYVGFPFYSQETDHKSFWPKRLFDDRHVWQEKIIDFLSDQRWEDRITEILELDTTGFHVRNEDGTELPPNEALTLKYSKFRRLLNVLIENTSDIPELLGADLFQAYTDLESEFYATKEGMPNTLLKVKLAHDRNDALNNVSIALSVLGNIYDVALDGKPVIDSKEMLEYNPGNKLSINIGDIPAEVQPVINIWYNYIPLSSRVTKRPIYEEFEKSHGVKIHTISADGVENVEHGALIADKNVVSIALDKLELEPDNSPARN